MQTNLDAQRMFDDICSKYGNVRNDLFSSFRKSVGREITTEDMENLAIYLNSVSNCIEYKNSKGDTCWEEDAKYLWLSTNIENQYGATVYVAFVRYESDMEFLSYYVGTYEKLTQNLGNYVDADSKNQLFYKEFYQSLLQKEGWESEDNTLIRDFILICEARVKNKPGLAVANKDGSKLAYNTGLLDIYGNDIQVMLDNTGNEERSIIHSKNELLAAGFAQTKIAPIQFYEKPGELLFRAKAEDFDLENQKHLKHILDERRGRLPDVAKDMGPDVLFSKIQSSLEFDLRMLSRNPHWAVPFYSVKTDEIQYFLPLYLTRSFSEAPDLAMIVGKGEYFYEIRTVLSLKKAYANAICVAPPSGQWIKK